jgi:sugar phosphate permease
MLRSKASYFTNLLLLIVGGEAIFFLPFVLPRIFRPTVLQSFDLTNTELGLAFSVYGVVGILSYFFGGFIADRFPAKYLMSISLLSTGLLGLWMSAIPSFREILIIYGCWGVSTVLLFWSPLIRTTRILGGDGSQGKTFGGLESGRGLVSALLGTAILFYFSSDSLLEGSSLMESTYKSTAIFVILMGALLFFLLSVDGENKSEKFDTSIFYKLLKMRALWQQTLFVLCAYVAYKCTDDLSLYAYDVLKYNDQKAALVGTYALWLRPIAALAIGVLADYLSVRFMSIICFILASCGSILLYILNFESMPLFFFLNLTVMAIGIYAMRGLYFAIMNEGGLPVSATGMAVGIISVLGFTPDVFMGPIMGYFLDSFPGIIGHQYLFGFCSILSIIGLVNLIFYPRPVKSN